jgi:amino acid transporter
MSQTLDTESGSAPPATGGLKRELKTTDAAAFSIGLIGPVGGMALLGAGAAAIIGGAATLAFVFAVIGVGLVAYGFVKLSRHISHTGSVYALVGVTLGPRAGFVAGWALVGAYLGIAVGSSIEFGLFLGNFLRGIHVTHSNEWIWWTLIAIVVVTALSFREIRTITRALLVSELIGAVLVAALSVIILIRVGSGHVPHGFGVGHNIFSLPSGTGIGKIGAAAVFGFLAFAGFEGAAALGEETENPKRDIPKALKVAIVIVSVFFLLVIVSQSLGYGTNGKGVAAFAGTDSPYGDLGTAYVGSWFADILNLVASVSLFAILLGTVAAGARIFYALARDAGPAGEKIGFTRLSRIGAPVTTLCVALAVVLVTDIVMRIHGTPVLSATFEALTLGTVSLLVAYGLATLGALRFLFARGARRAPSWQVVIPVLAVLFVAYTIYKNAVGLDFPYNWFPLVVAIWLIVGILLVVFTPGLAARVRRNLALSGGEPDVPGSTVTDSADPLLTP